MPWALLAADARSPAWGPWRSCDDRVPTSGCAGTLNLWAGWMYPSFMGVGAEVQRASVGIVEGEPACGYGTRESAGTAREGETRIWMRGCRTEASFTLGERLVRTSLLWSTVMVKALWTHTDPCATMFAAASLTITRKVGAAHVPIVRRRRDKMWSIHATEYYSALEREEILTPAPTWMDPENTMPSEISQTQKDTFCVIPLL